MEIFNRLFRKTMNIEEKAFNSLYPAKSSKKIRKKISQLVEETLEKTKKYGGDPFHEYRKMGILPETFEYGMNCFLDFVTVRCGEKLAQKVYEELKNTPNSYTLKKETSTYDVAGIPILFGIKGLLPCIDIHNNAINRIKEEMLLFEIKLSTEKPYFLQKLENETEDEYAWKLAAIDMGLVIRISILHEEGKYLECEQLKVYTKVIEKLTHSSNNSATNR